MIEIRSSTALSPNTRVRPARRRRGEDNLAWLQRVMDVDDPAGVLVLVGGAGLDDFRLRVAQSQARRDLLPSFWSHVAIVKGRAGQDLALHEVSVSPRQGFGPVARANAVQQGLFGAYADPEQFPNVAYARLTTTASALPEGQTLSAAVDRAVATFQTQRSLVNLADHLVEWLGFLWGASGRANPLLKGIGIPSAVFAESVFGIVGIELSPGLAANTSCPETIWQALKWWHDFYASEATLTAAPPSGAYVIDQPAAAVTVEPSSRTGPRARRSARTTKSGGAKRRRSRRGRG